MRGVQTGGAGPAVGPPRLFAALPLPEPLRNELFAASGQIARELDGRFRRVPPQNLHLTLRFFGPEEGRLERERLSTLLRARLAERRPAPPTLRATGVSAFGSVRRARVVWVGLSEESVDDEAGRLVPLQRMVEGAARDIGLDPETRPFLPHVTIGRLRRPTRLPPEVLESLPPASPASAWSSAFTVTEFCLFASLLTPGGAVYRQLASFSLDGG